MKNLSQYRTNKQSGFTLIELVVVIVILGILAATAAPKFIDLQDDANTATLQGVKAAMQSAATLVHSKSLIKGNQDVVASDNDVFVTVNNNVTVVSFGYPVADYGANQAADATGSWTNLIETDVEAFGHAVVGGFFVVYSKGLYPDNPTTPFAANPPTDEDDPCLVHYTQVAAAGGVPVYTLNPC